MSSKLIALSFVTGLVAGAIFKYIEAPIPAPPNLAGVMGIVGIYAGYKLITHLGWSYDLLEALGI
jgi:XapX domain-containing protein